MHAIQYVIYCLLTRGHTHTYSMPPCYPIDRGGYLASCFVGIRGPQALRGYFRAIHVCTCRYLTERITKPNLYRPTLILAHCSRVTCWQVKHSTYIKLAYAWRSYTLHIIRYQSGVPCTWVSQYAHARLNRKAVFIAAFMVCSFQGAIVAPAALPCLTDNTTCRAAALPRYPAALFFTSFPLSRCCRAVIQWLSTIPIIIIWAQSKSHFVLIRFLP